MKTFILSLLGATTLALKISQTTQPPPPCDPATDPNCVPPPCDPATDPTCLPPCDIHWEVCVPLPDCIQDAAGGAICPPLMDCNRQAEQGAEDECHPHHFIKQNIVNYLFPEFVVNRDELMHVTHAFPDLWAMLKPSRQAIDGLFGEDDLIDLQQAV